MSTDPRSINYPAINDRDKVKDEVADPPETNARENIERRTGTNDELKELDRAERRKK